MNYADALEFHPQGCIIRFEVVAGSSRVSVPSGFNPWRKALEARLTEEPTHGQANRQLIAELARVLAIPESEIWVMKGEKSSRKLLMVRGMGKERAASILGTMLERQSKK